jgi:hypothetical protein
VLFVHHSSEIQHEWCRDDTVQLAQQQQLLLGFHWLQPPCTLERPIDSCSSIADTGQLHPPCDAVTMLAVLPMPPKCSTCMVYAFAGQQVPYSPPSFSVHNTVLLVVLGPAI